MITILAVDDSVTIRNLIKARLSQNPDYNVELAETGKQGIQMAKSTKPDLILLDYVLPDCQGNMVCANLLNDIETKHIPIILLSSNADDITKAKAAYSNVVRTLLKPFHPPLLSATVNTILKNRHLGTHEAAVETTGTTPPLFSGNFNYFSPCSVLEAIDQGDLNGVLRVLTKPAPLEFYFYQGRPLYGITRDSSFYLENFPYPMDDIPEETLKQVKVGQSETGYPLFLALHDKGELELKGAITCIQDQTYRLFSRILSNPTMPYEFIPQLKLPIDLKRIEFPEISMDQWALECLRCVGKEALSLFAWGDSSGIPCFTRKGCDRVENIHLNDEEYAFASSVNNLSSLQQIGSALNYQDIEEVQIIFFRFLALDIMDYWPSSLAGVKQT